MQAIRPKPNVLTDLIRGLEERLAFANGDDLSGGDERQQLVESPNAAERQRVVAATPLGLKVSEVARRVESVPVIGHIDQIPAGRAIDKNLLDAVRGSAIYRNAPLEGAVRPARGC
jgi:hypothetical protein